MSQATTSLRRRGDPFAEACRQLVVLSPQSDHERFDVRLRRAGVERLLAESVEILQVNLGKLCNMACEHCHVDAGPDRREIMQRTTIDACLDVLRGHPNLGTLDLTGGAPEMNPHFRHFVREARLLGRHVIDRCNLTILLAKGFDDLPEFLAEHQVEVVASLPCYLEENADAQRGDGAFTASIESLRILNELGYGREGSGLTLTLVYNPVGPNLPPNQEELEAAYRRELGARYGIRFNRLFTITNMPISRYLAHLVATNQFDQYMQKLIDAFNPAAINGLMCRNTISVGWDGRLYDCDFNQMLDLEITTAPSRIGQFDNALLSNREIEIGQHCFGCTAGAGSGCQGAISPQ
jgi:radical SAM/Cys-rich protein